MDRDVKIKIVLIIILTISLIGLFIYAAQKKEDLTKIVKKEKIDIPIYKLTVYRDTKGKLCLKKEEDCHDIAFEIETETDNPQMIEFTEDEKYILYQDNALKIYNTKENTSQKLKIYNYEQYNLAYDKEKKEVIGIIYKKDKIENNNEKADYKTIGFYNISLDKKLYESSYNELNLINNKYLIGKKIDKKIDDESSTETFLLSTTEETTVLSKIGFCEQYKIIKADKGYFIVEQTGCNEFTSTIYNEELQTIADNIENDNWSYDKEGYLYILDKNQVKKQDSKGDILKTSKSYSNIQQIIKKYIIYIENDKLKLTDDEDLDIVIAEWKKEYVYNKAKSSYIEEKTNNRYPGLYITLNINNEEQIYYFNPTINEITLYKE